MLNKVEIDGTITRDIETVEVGDNKIPKASFSIRGICETGTVFPNIECWREVAKSVASLKQGTKVLVTGSIKTRSYDKNGKKVYLTYIVADSVVAE